MPRKPPDPKRIARRNRELQIAEDYPLPQAQGPILEVDVLNTDAVLLEGLFSLAEIEAIAAHMRALRAD